MDGPCQLFGEQGIDAALAGDAAFARKSSSNDLDPEVAFPLGPGTGMTGMAVRLVDDCQADGLEPGGELLANSVGDAHRAKAGSRGGRCQGAV